MPIQDDPLIEKFAQLVGLEVRPKQSILESLLDLIVKFWRLATEAPWVVSQQTEIYPEI